MGEGGYVHRSGELAPGNHGFNIIKTYEMMEITHRFVALEIASQALRETANSTVLTFGYFSLKKVGADRLT